MENPVLYDRDITKATLRYMHRDQEFLRREERRLKKEQKTSDDQFTKACLEVLQKMKEG
jgi:hypothetical protein